MVNIKIKLKLKIFISKLIVNFLNLKGTTPKFTYQVFFMRKLWTNIVPGRDRNADVIFHYHQELPKLLRGYHKCRVDESIELASYIYRVRYNDDSSQLENIP